MASAFIKNPIPDREVAMILIIHLKQAVQFAHDT
jgi:hypothetical protein